MHDVLRARRVMTSVRRFLDMKFAIQNLLIAFLSLLVGCFYLSALAGQGDIPDGWTRIDAEGHFTFRVPKSMKLSSEERCVECAWGSTFSDNRINLHATYSSWDEGYAEHYLARQSEYKKETLTIAGRKAKIQTWRWERPVRGYSYYAEVKFYSLTDGRMVAEMKALCREGRDVDTAKRIFTTVKFLK